MQSLANKTNSDYFYANGSAGLGISKLQPWTPAAITTALWFDAADSSTITASGGSISQWNDKSGNTRNISQATAGLQPAYQTNIQNGLPAVYEAGDDYLLNASAISIRSLILLLKWEDTTGDWRTIVSGATSGGDGNWSGNTAPGNPMFGSFSSSEIRSGTGHINGSSLSPGSWVRYTSNTIHAITTQTSNVDVRLWGGDRVVEFPTRGFKGWYYEIIAFASSVSTTNRQLCEGYLAWKWGMVASLPADHPYKNAAPTL
jgi:hypothetical protein